MSAAASQFVCVRVPMWAFFTVRRIPGATYEPQADVWRVPEEHRDQVSSFLSVDNPLPETQGARQLAVSSEQPARHERASGGGAMDAPPPLDLNSAPAVSATAVAQSEVPAGSMGRPGPTFVVPEKLARMLKMQPWAHQREALRFGMKVLFRDHGLVLAAEMATGKTFMATMLALTAIDSMKPALGSKPDTGLNVFVICPLRVIDSWLLQLSQYISIPYIAIGLDDRYSIDRRAEEADKKRKQAEARGIPFFLITNYDAFWRTALGKFLEDHRWDVGIYDESHKLKSPTGRASIFAKRLLNNTAYRIAATGTFLAHSPLDAFGQMRAIAPHVLGSNYGSFRQTFAKLGGPTRKWVVGYKNIDLLEKKLAPLTFRATKREALPDLPAEQSLVQSVEFTKQGQTTYDQMESQLIAEVDSGVVTAANAMVKVLRLQQITGGAIPDEQGRYHIVDDSKKKLLEDVLDDLGDQPAVIFCRFRSDIAAAHEASRAADRKSYELSGSRNDLQYWQKGIRRPDDPETRDDKGPPLDLVVQVQSGSVGITLIRAAVAIFYSFPLSLAEFSQAKARIHRPGQMRSCLYLSLCVKGSIDEKILGALERGEEVIEAIMTNIQNRSRKELL